MKNTLLFTTLFFISFLSCKNDDDNFNNTCNVLNPVEDLSWLKEQIAELETENSTFLKFMYFSQTKYDEQTVYVLRNCCPYCNTAILVYNCEGIHIGTIGNDDNDITPDILKNEIIIWEASNFECFKKKIYLKKIGKMF
ncbi:hypothetical protein Q4Q35_01325 [Flavivirga aquimarina]|uniref:Lipoprotein n=1 Tax=Flavivirga aquimarina TaxID=2027862 RepID=A0ABT8W5P6_9FLAO|nr:hypothetical protein [Flavivirga aquimarina]MDO5968438.1 hypothetical protein [Flavivirga aquimarina]